MASKQLTKLPITSSFKVLTYNVWFSHYEMLRRTREQIRIIHEEDPDVICLQEVTDTSRREFLKALSEKYDASPLFGMEINSGYGIMTLCKKKFRAGFRMHRCETRMDRHVLECSLFSNNQDDNNENNNNNFLSICNVHLESLSNHSLREKQLIVAERIMKDKKSSIVCGDFNFDSTRNYSGRRGVLQNDSLKKILPNHIDVWQSLYPDDKGYTFDTETNLMIGCQRSRKKSERMRYDRILASYDDDEKSCIRPINMYRIGTDPIVDKDESEKRESGERCVTPPPSRKSILMPQIGNEAAPFHLFPSDHYGLVAEFNILSNT